MSLRTRITDPITNRSATVKVDDALSVAPAKFSKAYNATMGVSNQIYNVVPLQHNCSFVITGIFVKANRQVSNTVDATVEIFEASSAESGTVLNSLFTIPMVRGETFLFNPIYVKVENTSYINARTNDDDVYVTILGFYVEDINA